jgi:hypothetical protein
MRDTIAVTFDFPNDMVLTLQAKAITPESS